MSRTAYLLLFLILPLSGLVAGTGRLALLEADAYRHHIDFFNRMEPEGVVNLVPNDEAWDWLNTRIPFFESSDATVEEIYYFRWWALRKHLKRVGDHFVFTEFIELETTAPFIPPERTIASALGHHFRETRWLTDQSYDDSYLDYWMVGNEGDAQPHFRRYSSWLQHTLWERVLVTGDFAYLEERFERLVDDYRIWQETHQDENGLYWSHDVWDAMEESISGSRTVRNYRPTLNSYMYGNAKALAAMARRFGFADQATAFEEEAARLRDRVTDRLWNEENVFYEVMHPDGTPADVREQIGFIPWYFNLPYPDGTHARAWAQLTDPSGFRAPYGLTTAERRHPRFRSHNIGTCEWDGAIWPFATSQTLVAMANLLRDYPASPVNREDYLDAFVTYTRAQYYDGLPYIGEYHDEVNGQWLKGRHPRSYYYHHSTYADPLISGLIGLTPVEEALVRIEPLIPEGAWRWFAVDGIPYRGHFLTIFWDHDGSRYGHGAGLHLWIDGRPAAHSVTLDNLEAQLP
jgi:hypothetical protein